MTVQEAYKAAQKMIDKAKGEAMALKDSQFRQFAKKHGGVKRVEEMDFNHTKDSWMHQKQYIMNDNANWYETIFYPESEMGLRIEYWSDDQKTTTTYL